MYVDRCRQKSSNMGNVGMYFQLRTFSSKSSKQ